MNRFPLSGYVGRTAKHLEEIIRFLKETDADVIGLVEVDSGSYRSRKVNQAERIASALGHYHTYKSKYAKNHPLLTKIPILNKQGNAFITKNSVTREQCHYVTRGVKKLVMELELENVVFLLVHLALSYKTRMSQLRELKQINKNIEKPCIVAGDFNVLTGQDELELFREAAGLLEPHGGHAPTFPSWKPKMDLDFVFHTEGIRVSSLKVPHVLYSDHLPVICEFEVL
jgi:endonuclease/exonuclease/phosphatase family metal-dependent hydrolase